MVLDNELYVFNADLRVAISKSQLTTCRVALIDLIVSGGQKKYLFFSFGPIRMPKQHLRHLK